MTAALDFFRQAREAARDAESTRVQLEALRRQNRADVGQHEARLKARIERDRDVIDRACSVLYDSERGVATVLSPQHADCLWWRYCQDSPWKQVARNLGISYTTAHQLHRESLSMIDESHLIESI